MTNNNKRVNPQNKYYPDEELDNIFEKIWRALRKTDPSKEVFLPESQIKDSAIYKASPLRKLTPEQLFTEVTRQYDDFAVHVRFYLCPVKDRTLDDDEHAVIKWVRPQEIEQLDWVEADKEIVAKVAKMLFFLAVAFCDYANNFYR